MKNMMIIMCMIAIAFNACRKKDKGEQSKGEVQCEYNGISWVADFVHFTNDNPYNIYNNLYIEVVKSNNNVRTEFIYLTNIPKTLLKQRLYKGLTNNDSVASHYFTTDLEEDVGCDYYQVYEADSLNNWIQITKEAGNYVEIWGKFSVTYLKESGCEGSPYPDTVRIRNGTFHIWQ